MARIRTVKPDFFRHEGLQELEEAHPRIMLFFAGLWCQCDKAGHFRWRPKQIRLDVLPFIEYNPSTYLEVLEGAGYLSRYEAEGESYGEISNFKRHQLIWGSEVKSPLKHPLREKEVLGPNQGSTEDIGVRSQEAGDIDSLREDFKRAVQAYPSGKKRGAEVEWADFLKKNRKRAREVVPLLLPAVLGYVAQLKANKTEPGYIKNMQGWITEERWTTDYSAFAPLMETSEEKSQRRFRETHI